jgi:SAM-dependent methyltransferase
MAFEELKARHAAMWGSAPFERIAVTLAEMHQAIVRNVGGGPGSSWLDVGCGTGELALMAAETGAEVTAADLSPALVETARRQAAERGAPVTFEVADAEALPYPDESFDVVTSTVGAMFAPDHDAVAAELARVCRPGGKLGFTAWTTDGGVDEFFEIIASYAPPPHPEAGVPMRWGDADYCREMLGDAFDLEITTHNTPWRVESPEEFWEEMSEGFGPIKTLLGGLSPDRAEAFRSDLFAFLERERTPEGVRMDRYYNLVKGLRRA